MSAEALRVLEGGRAPRGWEELWIKDVWSQSELPHGDLASSYDGEDHIHFEGLLQTIAKNTAVRARAALTRVRIGPSATSWPVNGEKPTGGASRLVASEPQRTCTGAATNAYEGHDSFGSSGFQATLKVANELRVKTTPLKYLRAKKGDELRATPRCAQRRLVRDLRARVARLQRDRPDVVFALSYLDDAALVVQTMATRGYRPPAMLVYGAGYANPEFVARARAGNSGCGLDAAKPDGIISRSSGGWPTRGAAELKVARMFKQRLGASITDTTARSFTATIALATAINAAGSTDSTRIRDAMRSLDISADQTILPDHGITFDPRGQNEGALAVLEQMVGGRYITVYPPSEGRPPVRWPLRKGFGVPGHRKLSRARRGS